jgi:succinate dehydrogenase / fumarate reductase cytochrome b subunit
MNTNYFSRYLKSSIVRKQILATTGLLLTVTFLIPHLIGNCLFYLGPEIYNTYSHKLISNPITIVAEIFWCIVFLTHLGLTLKLTIENKKARPDKYFMKVKTGRGATFPSSTMPLTGFVILVFLILHLLDFKYGPLYTVTYDGVEMRDLYKLMTGYFSTPLEVLWYIFAQICIGLHLSHGLWSTAQTFGFNHPKYNSLIRKKAIAIGLFVAIGFSALPICAYIQGGH